MLEQRKLERLLAGRRENFKHALYVYELKRFLPENLIL
jgi:hypothetical protein